MAEAKAKTEVTMKMSATCPHHSRADVSVRDVESVARDLHPRWDADPSLS